MTEFANIPTTYAGVRFRSRLEAKWACFFDQLGIHWEYELLDLNGWIPDFMVHSIPRPHLLIGWRMDDSHGWWPEFDYFLTNRVWQAWKAATNQVQWKRPA